MYKYDADKKAERLRQFEKMAEDYEKKAKSASDPELQEEYATKAENYAAMAEDLRFSLEKRGYSR